jgi:hypothetical protein
VHAAAVWQLAQYWLGLLALAIHVTCAWITCSSPEVAFSEADERNAPLPPEYPGVIASMEFPHP